MMRPYDRSIHPERRPGALRSPIPVLAVTATLGAAFALGGVGLAIMHLGGERIILAIGLGMVVLLGSATCLLISSARATALLLLWNAFGMVLALLLIGIFSVGALMQFPIALIAVALSAWPREEDQSIVTIPAMAAEIMGFALIPASLGLSSHLGRLASLLG